MLKKIKRFRRLEELYKNIPGSVKLIRSQVYCTTMASNAKEEKIKMRYQQQAKELFQEKGHLLYAKHQAMCTGMTTNLINSFIRCA